MPASHLLDVTVAEDCEPVAHRQGFLLVVRHVDERDPDLALDALELDLHPVPKLEVEGSERLVEQQHLQSVDDRPCERDPLPLAARELRRPAAAEPGQLHHLQRLADPFVTLRLAHLLDHQAVADVLRDGHVREECVVLEDRVHVPVVRRGGR